MRLYIYLLALMMGMSAWATEKARTEINGTKFENQTDSKQNMELEELLGKANQGDAEAQNNLGLMYDLGQGVEQDYKKAIEWYEKAAEQGYAKAQYNLGIIYHKGQGVEKDYVQAVMWYEKAAEQGDADAQYKLGLAYDTGFGVDYDESKAREWYEKAAEQGHEGAKDGLELLGE